MERYSNLISIFVCCLSLAAAAAAAASTEPIGPKIQILPKETTFHVDASNPGAKILICQTFGDKPHLFTDIRWSGPNKQDNWEELRKRHNVYEEESNSNVWNLEFKNPTSDDSGTYHCRGVYQSTDVLNSSIEVKIESPIKLVNCPDRQFVVDGTENAMIKCQVTADQPKIILYRNNQNLEHSQRYKWDNDEGLVIHGIANKSDAGVYTLKVRSQTSGLKKDHPIHVEVHSKPEILSVNSSRAAIEGEQTELECKVDGYPRPLVYWMDPKMRNLTFVGGYIVDQVRGTLLINRVNKVDDDGEFTCFAYNTVGTTSQRLRVGVLTRPNIVSFENKTVDEGSEVTFECRSTGQPQPAFSIRKQGHNQLPYRAGDGKVRDTDTVAEGGGSDVFIHRLKIVADRSNFGLHYCNSSNTAGTAEKVSMLTVNHKPDLSATPPEQFVKIGKKFTITCHIKAYPTPTITWRSDNTQIVNVDSVVKTSPDGQVHIVTMSPPALQQTAFNRYVCEAENRMGKSEQTIIPRYTTAPGAVSYELVERKPTTIKLRLSVPNDGGDRVKFFKYRAEGRTQDMHNPYYNYRDDRQNETLIDASLATTSVYTIRNLLPYYIYKFTIRAINDVGDGDLTEFNMETTKPTEPEPPIIVNSGLATAPGSDVPSEYSNGYLLRWSPPELDNGDPVINYIIKCYRVVSDSLASDSGLVEERVVEQMNERPMNAKLGPLEAGNRYKIQIQARNKFGISKPAQILIYVTPDRPIMHDLEAQTLAWLGQTSTPTLVIVIVSMLVVVTIIELIFNLGFQIGATHALRSWCCSAKTNSVISDRTYT